MLLIIAKCYEHLREMAPALLTLAIIIKLEALPAYNRETEGGERKAVALAYMDECR